MNSYKGERYKESSQQLQKQKDKKHIIDQDYGIDTIDDCKSYGSNSSSNIGYNFKKRGSNVRGD